MSAKRKPLIQVDSTSQALDWIKQQTPMYAISAEEQRSRIFRRGDEIVLREKDGTMERAFDLLAGLPEDLAVARAKDRPQKRKGL